MKLSHLSLAVFSAIALAACGGSGNDQTTIKKDPPKDPPKEVPAGDKGPVVVSNEANATVVAAGSEQSVNAAKQVYFDRDARDLSVGYVKNGTKLEYKDGSTKPADLERLGGVVNYVDAGWVNDDDTLRLNPLQTYAKGNDGNYYRITRPTGQKWGEATSNSTFTVVNAGSTHFGNASKIKASELVYIPNVWAKVNDNGALATNAYYPAAGEMTSDVANELPAVATALAGINKVDSSITYDKTPAAGNTFDITREQVDAHTLNFAGKSYKIDTLDNDVQIDFSGVKIAQEIQELPITIDYTVTDGKGTTSSNDDDKYKGTANAGQARVYNLNYSRALVLMNQGSIDEPGKAISEARNTFALSTGGKGYAGPFQVVGRKTGTLPTNGRAIYTGKSFGIGESTHDVTSGDIKLEADFGIDRASISGSVTNRTAKTATGEKKLPDWSLQEILLSQPSSYSVTGSRYFNGSNAKNGEVFRGGSKVGLWTVQLFGANAENASGIIFKGNNTNTPIEVFGSARGDIEPKSLNN